MKLGRGMGDQANTNPPAGGTQPQQAKPAVVKKVGNSPWDEELDLPAEPKKPIVGSLEPSAPFAVPENVQEKVGQKVPAANFVAPAASAQTQPPAGPAPIAPVAGPDPLQPMSAPIPSPRMETITPPPSNMPKPIVNTVDNVTATGSPSAVVEDFADIVPPSQTEAVTASQPEPMSSQKQSLFAKLFPAKQPSSVANVGSSATSSAQPQELPGAPDASESTIPAAQIESLPKGGPGKKILLVSAVVLLLLVFLSALTELGFLSIGLEKAYGAVGLESLWGGLSGNPEKALALSASKMKNYQSYKISGNIKITVDGQGKSEIITPLIYSAGGLILARDSVSGSVIPAIKAAVEDYEYDLYNIDNTDYGSTSTTDTSVSDTTTSADTTATSTTTSSETSSDTSTTTADAADDTAADASSTESLQVIDANVELKTGQDGIESNIKINDNQNSLIDLVNTGSNLYVKTSGAVVYNEAATSDQWTKYEIPTLEGKKAQTEVFNIQSNSGLSVKGTRAGSEKVGGVRCYHYHLDSVELGNSLTALGIESDMTQTISGDVWIGVRDKLIKKMTLNITTPVSATARIITADLTFSDFGVTNSITSVADADTVSVQPGDDQDDAVVVTGDAKRKADLDKIATALNTYFGQYSSYPIAATSIKLNQSGNVLERALVPTFIQAMPLDEAPNWYYGYISDGTNFTLTARLENLADPAGTKAGSILLYTKTNK